MSDELKPCPFCKCSYDKDDDDYFYSGNHKNWRPLRGTAYGGYGLTVPCWPDAVAAWNTRADEQSRQPVDKARNTINALRAYYGAGETTMTDEQIQAGMEHYRPKREYDFAVVDELSEQRPVDNGEADSRELLEEAMRNVIRDALLNLKTAIMCCVEQGMDVLSFDEREFVDFEPEEYVDEYLLRAMRLLNRQAAITERELCGRCSPYATAKDYLDTIDSLTAERDEWKAKAEEEKANADVHWRIAKNLVKERDELREKLDEKQRVIDVQRDSFAKMERECAELRQMLSDAAEAI